MPTTLRPKGVKCRLFAGLFVTHVKAFLMSLVTFRSCSFVSHAATGNCKQVSGQRHRRQWFRLDEFTWGRFNEQIDTRQPSGPVP